ncbi:hypothetical protein LguiA_036540 [Lonicera macranthoides]
MGGVAVVQPQNYLKDRLPRHNYYSTMKTHRNQNPNFQKPIRRKRSPTSTAGNHSNTPAAVSNSSAKSLAMGQVKILKRGEPLTDAKERPSEGEVELIGDMSLESSTEVKSPRDRASNGERTKPKPKVEKVGDLLKPTVEFIGDLALSTTDRFGPDPNLLPKKINIAELYAGSGFFDSPPPSSLPLPAFFTKKCKADPTADLRRILGLN